MPHDDLVVRSNQNPLLNCVILFPPPLLSRLYLHSSSLTKQQIVSKVEEQAEANLGGAMMYTLFEWAKENQESLMEDHQPVVTAVVGGLCLTLWALVL